MVRTKAEAGSSKVTVSKAPRKIVGGGASSSNGSPFRIGSSKDKYSGGNSYNPQPTPNWQKGISTFFKPPTEKKEETTAELHNNEECGSSSKNISNNSSPKKSPLKKSDEGSSSSKTFQKNGLISDDEDD